MTREVLQMNAEWHRQFSERPVGAGSGRQCRDDRSQFSPRKVDCRAARQGTGASKPTADQAADPIPNVS